MNRSSVRVLIAHAEGEEAKAWELGAPLEQAGYQVVHGGKLLVGQSLVAEASKVLAAGGPLVICGTIGAVGTGWARRLVRAALHHRDALVLPVRMEKGADLEGLDFLDDVQIAEYWQDPARVTTELCASLAKRYPSTEAGPLAREDWSAADRPFLDQPTEVTTFDIEELELFRNQLREEMVEQYPRDINPWEFLSRAGVLVNDHLTRTGVLLFAKNPTTICPTAIVMCTRYFGNDVEAKVWDRKTFQGTVRSQIIASQQFVADHVRSGETRGPDAAQSISTYEYPMIAVRELIANALVHRDYRSAQACVHVRLFSDHLEVASPGDWIGFDLTDEQKHDLANLQGQSIKRNFRLANILSWIRLVEGEGRGIPAALQDCRAMQAASPMVARQQEFVIVTLQRPQPPAVAVTLPPSEAQLIADGLIVWTGRDFSLGLSIVENGDEVEPIEAGELVDLAVLRQGRLPNLQRDFASLAEVFDRWLARPSTERGHGKIRILWLEADAGPHRSKAFLACLSRAGRSGRAVYDAGGDVSLAARALSQSMSATGYAIPPLVGIDLEGDQAAAAWTEVASALANARKRSPANIDQGRMIVAGTAGQWEAAYDSLHALAVLEPIDTRGRDRQYPYTFHGLGGMESRTLSRDDVLIQGLPSTTQRLFNREEELRILRQAWTSDSIRILSVVAYGGTGKSALINSWLREMRERDYEGARKVLAWSFYNQGTTESLVSADPFVSSALSWLGDDESITLNPWARGRNLASLVKQRCFLLVLDGIEVLQYPPAASHVGGELTDESVRALLEELARPDWTGLCVLTTRVPLTDLRPFEDGGPGGPATVLQLELENLDDQAGAALLKDLIREEAPAEAHAEPSFRDLQRAVREVEGHALAITLLGNYLRDVHGGDLAGRFDLERLTIEVREGGHARRIMASYVQWLERYARFAELGLLMLIGLFDRPAPPEAMAALLSGAGLGTFTDNLDRVGGEVWNQCVDALRGMGLLNDEIPDQPGTLDAHPLVREHFRELLQRTDRNLWVQANRILFGYYADQAPPRPSDSDGMSTLYAAVTHGCAAGLHQEVFDDILLKRIWRDRRTSFSTRRLGMISSDLVALSNYFHNRRWTELQKIPLSEGARVLILTNAGVRLRQLGRLDDARQCFGAVLREIDPVNAGPEELEQASYAAAQSCELLGIAGKLADSHEGADTALDNGQKAIEYSDRCTDPYFSMHARSSLAEVHFMLGDLDRADALFEEARAVERDRHPTPGFFYSQSLFRYGYYLIETNRADVILADEGADPEWGTNGDDSSLLSGAIRLIVMGAARRARIEGGNRDPELLDQTEKILDESVRELLTAGYADYLVRGLLERAHFYRVRHQTEDYTRAMQDLDRATFEARRGQMDLLYADILLQRTACYLEFWPQMTSHERSTIRGRLSEAISEATALVGRLGYQRRAGVLDRLHNAAAMISPGLT